MKYSEYPKEIVLRALNAGKKFKFVESTKDVEDYSLQKIYAIKKDSPILKELVNEGKFPIDDRFLNLQKGHYHIIDIYQKETEFKGQTRIDNIAYALYREKENGDFWNKIYRIKINPLTNYISRRLFSEDDNLNNLIRKTICVFDFNLDKEARSYKVTWEGVEEIEIHLNEEEYQNYLIDKMNEEEYNEELEYENYLIDQEMLSIAEEESMYIDDLMEQEMLNIAMEEAEAEAIAMTEYIEATEADITIEQVDLEEENEKFQ